MIDALVELEHRTREAGGLVLRMGHLYGPGTIYAFDGFFTEQVRARAVPLVGGGRSVFSFTHVEDAATAMLAALDRPPPESSISSTMPPRRSPIGCRSRGVGRCTQAAAPARGDRPTRRWRMGACISTRLRGADNARARETLNWRPRYSSWRQGFQHEFGQRFPDASGNETVPANAA